MKIYIVVLLILTLPLPIFAADSLMEKFAQKIAKYELPAPNVTDDLLVVNSKANNEWTLSIRNGPVTKRSIVACNTYVHISPRNPYPGTSSEGCDLQVGRIINGISPTKENKEKILYISEISDFLYIVDGT